MPFLGIAKKRLGARLDSEATTSSGLQNLLCAHLAAAVLAGLLASTLLGWWWLDPAIGLASPHGRSGEGAEAPRGEE
jgi:divalent metal cation (Fe/Co/Zn/Cd) transporter